MSYNAPGTRFEHNQEEAGDVDVDNAELPTCVIGPLFQVVEDGQAPTSFDPLDSANQAFVWPDQKAGTTVDLAGIRNGVIDSQRRDKAPFVPRFRLKDDRGFHDVDDKHVWSVDTGGFEIEQEARDGLHRTELTSYPVQVDDTYFYRKDPAGDRLSTAEPGDRFTTNGNKQTIQSVTDNRIYVEDNNNFTAPTPAFEGDGAAASNITAQKNSDLPGRVDLKSASTGTFSAYSKDQVIVTGHSVTGFKGLGDGSTAVDGAPTTSEISIDAIPFTQSLSQSEVDQAIVQVKDDNSGDVYFYRLKSIDTSSNTMTVETFTNGSATGWATDGDIVSVTIYKSQVGYIEDINTDDDVITAVVPNVFAEGEVFVQVFSTTYTFKTYPVFDVSVTYRALRQDLVGNTYEAGGDKEIKDRLGAESIHMKDGLGFAASCVASAQPNDRNVHIVPVDTFTNGIDTGYKNALDTVRDIDVYMLALMDRSPSIESDLESHVTTMSSQDMERRGFFWYDIPLGDYNQSTGEITPGRTSTGTRISSDDGNKVLRDADLDFVAEAEVQDGTEVVVTYPEEFAGTYKAQGLTTDNDLILYGDDWGVTHEFEPVLSDPSNSSNQMDVTTDAGVHKFTVTAGYTLNTGHFAHVEEGDYVDAKNDSNGTWYRMRIVSVASDGKSFEAVDEVPGDPSWSGQTFSGVSIIRSWGYDDPQTSKVGDVPPNVEYHIRPLSTDKQVDRLKTLKTQYNRRLLTTLDYRPTVEFNGATDELSTAYTIAHICAKRSGLQSHDPITNLYLGGYITGCKYASAYFSGDEKDELAAEGFVILEQESSQSEPSIRDMITSSTSDNLVNTEDMVVSNLDWQGKTVRKTLGPPKGEKLPRLTDRLLGVRAIQLSSVLEQFKDDDRVRRSHIVDVSRNDNNERQSDLEYDVWVPTPEKEIKVTANEKV